MVAVAPDWPGLERGAATGEAAVARLQSYVPRYAQVAELAGMSAEFTRIAGGGGVDVVEEYPGNGSTDYWGISFVPSSLDRQDVSGREFLREMALLQACWAFFDGVRSRVSAEMQKGPRGGGRDRDVIVRHVFATERDWAEKVGVRILPTPVVPDEKQYRAHRDAYGAAIRQYHAEGRMARTWPLRFLVRHTAYHAMDHAWEMEDKDLTTTDRAASPAARRGGARR